jgi:hypothetical protein
VAVIDRRGRSCGCQRYWPADRNSLEIDQVTIVMLVFDGK